MNGRIGQLQNTYRLLGEPDTLSAAVRERLDRLAAKQLAEVVADALSQLFGGEDTVYVLRQVVAPLSLQVHDGMPEAQLAQRWGRQLSGHIVRTIAGDPGDGRNLRRFDNEAHFVSRFIVDLLHGHAWDAWYYGAFQPYRDPSLGSTVLQVLLDRKAHLPAILRQLAEAQVLDQLLAALSPEQLAFLWQMGLDAAPLADEAALRPLWSTAGRLLTLLDLWQEPAPDLERLWPLYLATNPFGADWRDQRALASTILSIIRFFGKRGFLRSPPLPRTPLEQRLSQALPGLDWVDNAWLERSLLQWFTAPAADAPAATIERPLTTPRQKSLLSDVLAVLDRQPALLGRSQPAAAESALRLYTALIAQAEQWAGDPLAAAMIARMLFIVHLLQELGVTAGALDPLRQGDLHGALALTPETDQEQTAALFRQILSLGPEALAVVTALLTATATAKSAAAPPSRLPIDALPETWLPSAYAGLFLLLRACLDLRLPHLVHHTGWPPSGELDPLVALLAALGRRLAGSPDDHFDPGLSLWAGGQLPADLAASWPEATDQDILSWQTALLKALLNLRLVQPEHMLLYELVLEDRPILIASDGTGTMWPFARHSDGEQSSAATAREWQSLWLATTGVKPALLTAVQAAEDEQWRSIYNQGAERLRATLDALEHGTLAVPQVDLNMALLSAALLRVWSRWLRPFATSSPPYLLQQFIRRPGALMVKENRVHVALAARPLDLVLEMAGYLSAVEYPPWLPYGQIIFQMGDPL